MPLMALAGPLGPCQQMLVGSGSELVNWTRRVSPTVASTVGPGTWALYP